MKKLIKLTLVVALVLGSSSLFAQKPGPYQSRRDHYPYAGIQGDDDQHGGVQQRSARQPGNDSGRNLNTKYNDFQKNKATYSEVTRQLKEKELTDLQNRLQEFYQSAQEDLQKKEKEPD